MKKLFRVLMGVCALSLTACAGDKQEAKEENELNEQYHINFSEKSHVSKAHKRVVIISAATRKGGNTNLLCDEFARGAKEAGGNVEKIFLGDYNIGYFSMADMQGGSAKAVKDDAPELVEKLVDADIIVLSSPVYFMNITGQMKVFIDRTFSRYRDMKDKEFYYIVACADAEESTADYGITGLRGFVMCLPNPTERGYVKALCIRGQQEVKETQYMKEAYELGKKI